MLMLVKKDNYKVLHAENSNIKIQVPFEQIHLKKMTGILIFKDMQTSSKE